MFDWLNELEKLTLNTLENLQEMTDEQLLFFVEERGRILESIKQTGSDDPNGEQKGFDQNTRNRIQQLLQYDGMIQMRMQAMLTEYGLTFSKVQAAKKQKTAYDLEYTPDSLFFDKKK
ncbi:MAG: hypothetical protein K0R67_254 [Paenibacillus sp.]|jgi:hypothetical protein|nr:hypothetical protein [Paenibacillus sp.]